MGRPAVPTTPSGASIHGGDSAICKCHIQLANEEYNRPLNHVTGGMHHGLLLRRGYSICDHAPWMGCRRIVLRGGITLFQSRAQLCNVRSIVTHLVHAHLTTLEVDVANTITLSSWST